MSRDCSDAGAKNVQRSKPGAAQAHWQAANVSRCTEAAEVKGRYNLAGCPVRYSPHLCPGDALLQAKALARLQHRRLGALGRGGSLGGQLAEPSRQRRQARLHLHLQAGRGQGNASAVGGCMLECTRSEARGGQEEHPGVSPLSQNACFCIPGQLHSRLAATVKRGWSE